MVLKTSNDAAVAHEEAAVDSQSQEGPFVDPNETVRGTEEDSNGREVSWSRRPRRECCSGIRFQGKRKAQGFAFAACGHGSIFASNVFLSSSFILLANREAGCVEDDKNGEETITDDCQERIYGFKPSALVTNLATIAALLVAISLPTIGAIVDYTPHRKRVGQIVALSIFLIQTVLIGTVESTWFIMSIFQALVVALYGVHYAIATSYLPDIVRYDVDVPTFNTFNRMFYHIQFGGELVVLIAVILLASLLGADTVQTAQVGQAVAALWLVFCFGGAWKSFPEMPRRHEMPSASGQTNILTEGFRQAWRTAKAIFQQSPTLKWYFAAVMFGEAGTTAILPIVVTILSQLLKYDGTNVGIAFLLALLGAIAGVIVNAILSRKTNPIVSGRISLFIVALVTTAAMSHIPRMSKELYLIMGKLYGFLWGLSMGWYYAAEQFLFSVLMPKGQELELAGFFVYCTVVLTWLPPLIYSIIVEQGKISQVYGLSTLIACQVAACASLFRMGSWDVAIQSSLKPLLLLSILAPDVQEESHNETVYTIAHENVDRCTTNENEQASVIATGGIEVPIDKCTVSSTEHSESN